MNSVITGLLNGFREMWAHKVRSALSLIGVVMGVASLVAVFALVKGMFAGWEAWIKESGGIEKVQVVFEDVEEDQVPVASMSPGLSIEDAWALESSPLVEHASPETGFKGDVSFQENIINTQILACTPVHFEVETVVLDRGRFICDADVDTRARVIVIGSVAAEDLFPGGDPVGQEVLFASRLWTVVGVMQEKYVSERARRHMEQKNRTCYIPLTTGIALLGSDATITAINMKIVADDDTTAAVDQSEKAMVASHRGIRDVTFNTNDERIAQFNEQVEQNTIAGAFIGGLSLLVGGVGIMNIMLASISERLREIGIRKAVGATDFDIMIQILFETISLTVIGGAFGCLASWGLVEFLGTFMEKNTPIMSWSAMAIGFGFSVLVGVVFGIYPALKAAALNPIEALRAE